MTQQDFTLVHDTRATLGECPVWSVAEQALYFTDITGQRLHRVHGTDHEVTAIDLHEEVGCFALRKGGGLIAGGRTGVWHLDMEGKPVTRLAENPEPHATNRFNDGRTDPAGRFWLGTVDEPKAGGTAGLYRYDRRGLRRMGSGFLTSNGLAFSPDGRTMYHSDTPRFTIFAHDYDVETGEISNGRVFARLDEHAPDRARPDGGAVDVEGCYWSALYEGGRVRRYSPGGEVLSEHAVPSRCPTMIAFGGADLRTLYVTSARGGRAEDELGTLPHSGGLFALRTQVPGLPEPLFDPEA